MKYINNSPEKYLIKEKWHLGDYEVQIGQQFTWAGIITKPLIVGLY